MVNGIDLEPIQLKQPSLDGDITDKMKSLHGSHSADTILLFWQVPWLWPGTAKKAGGQRRACLLQRKWGARGSPHSPGMAVMGLGQLWGIADGIAFTLQQTAREETTEK